MDSLATSVVVATILCSAASLFYYIHSRSPIGKQLPSKTVESSDISSFKQYGEWAIVTGCTDGIGREIADQLHSMGYRLILVSRTESKLRSVADELSGSEIVVLDYSAPDYTSLKQVISDKKISVLVNNAGVFYSHPELLDKMSEIEVENILSTNVVTTTMVTSLVLKRMAQIHSEGKRKGLVLSISSGSSLFPCPLLSVYSASKSYLNHLMVCLRYEYPQFLFQTLTPFYIATKMSGYTANETTIPSVKKYVSEALSELDGKLKAGYQHHDIGIATLNVMSEESVGTYMLHTNKSG